MRVGTFTMYHDFTRNQEKSIKYLNDVNRQIASGMQIEYGYQNTNIFVNALRLDQEEYTLEQNALGANMAREFAGNSDSVMNQMVQTLMEFKTKLVKAASESNSPTDRAAIAQDLAVLRQHLINLANTSINGQYLFSGSAFTKKPIDANGNYNGNSDRVKALVSPGVQLPFNIDGSSLFLGSDNDYSRVVSTNVPKKNITLLHDKPPLDRYLTTEDKIRDLTGNNGDGRESYFYISGVQSDGTSFKQRIDISIDSKVSDLLDKIKDAYKGNVDVTLNNHGQIEIKDLQRGSSKLQFHIVGSDNSVAQTKAISGFSAGSTVLTLKSTANLEVGDKINVEGIGQVKITGVNVPGPNQITFTPPLPSSAKPEVKELNIKKVLSTDVAAPSTIVVGSNTITLDNLHVVGTKHLAVGDQVSIGNLGVFTITAVGTNTITFNSTVTGSVAVGDKVDFITNISDLSGSGVTVTEFIKSGMAPLSVGDAKASNDFWDHSRFNFNIEFKNRQTQKVAQPQDLLTAVLGNFPTGITLNGHSYSFSLGPSSTMRDLVNSIQSALDAEFGSGSFSASLADGKIVVIDETIDPRYADIESSQLHTMTLNAPANTFAPINGIESDRIYFKKEGAILSSNVSQVVKETNEYAKPSDTLLSTAGVTAMAGKKIRMDVIDINGNAKTVTIDFGPSSSTFTIGSNTYDIFNAASPQTTTPGDQVTYRQLMDVMSMVISDTLPAANTPADYNSAVEGASRRVAVRIDDKGKIVVEDKINSATKASLAMYDTSVNTGFTKSAQVSVNSITLNSNNALTVDDPYITLFDTLQAAIDAVKSGKIRASDNGSDPRNIGIQNAILAIDHVFDHVVRKHTDIGAIANAFQLSADRSTTLSINVKAVKSEVLDTDIASAYVELSQRNLNYQALLSTVSKINGLSLVNYL